MNEPVIKWMSVLSVKDDRPLKTVKERTPFLRGYGAIVHSSQFRRLSHKTQVFLNPNFDYVRTRLTHSLEVSQIGRQLAKILCRNIFFKKYAANGIEGDFHIDFEELVATACLAHDIGQAPFGHSGERQLDKLLESYDLQFDANKQNIRLLVGSEARDSLDVPYALVGAVMKYHNKKIFPKKEGAFFF